jgi:hypothetical protein
MEEARVRVQAKKLDLVIWSVSSVDANSASSRPETAKCTAYLILWRAQTRQKLQLSHPPHDTAEPGKQKERNIQRKSSSNLPRHWTHSRRSQAALCLLRIWVGDRLETSVGDGSRCAQRTLTRAVLYPVHCPYSPWQGTSPPAFSP